MLNRYFIANVPNPNMSQIYDICIGGNVSKRFSLDGSKVVVKLPLGDENDYGVLQNATEYTHEEILEVLNGNEWTNNEDL
jgi:hypothetical protein